MRRYSSKQQAPRVSLADGVVAGTLTGPSIARGELAILTEGGTFRRAHPALPLAALNNGTVGLSAIMAIGSTLPAGAAEPGPPLRLPGGNIVVPCKIITAGKQGFFIRDPAGRIVKTVEIGTYASTPNALARPPRVALLADGNFVVAYPDSARLLCADIYSPAGALIAATAITAVAIYDTSFDNNSKGPYFGLAPLAGGGFAVTYKTPSVNALGRLRFVSAAGVVGAEIVPDQGAYSCGYHLYCAPCANGDVLVRLHNDAANGFLYRYSAAGALVWSVAHNAKRLAAHPCARAASMLAELSDGKIATSMYTDGGGGKAIGIFSSAGAVVATISAGSMASGNSLAWCETPHGLAVVGSPLSSANTLMSLYKTDGTLIYSERTIDTGGATSATAANVGFDLAWVGTGLAATRTVYDNTTGRLLLTDMLGTPVGSVVAFGTVSNSYLSPLAGADDGLVYVTVADASTAQFGVYQAARSAIAGVAKAAATTGQAITILTAGGFDLPATQVFPYSGAFDGRAAVVPGVRGFLSNGRAVLFGFGSVTI